MHTLNKILMGGEKKIGSKEQWAPGVEYIEKDNMDKVYHGKK